jgi:hypothetical protein
MQDARDVSELYIAKYNPWIVMVSKPNAPEGLFERIEKEPEANPRPDFNQMIHYGCQLAREV